MATHPRLVNKQFNSPINLYSQQNIQDVLDRETQILANGAVGIDFRNPEVGKPGNLKNSAVLRMLEEEENRHRNGFGPGNEQIARPLRENITWPPPAYEYKNKIRSSFKDVVVPGAKRVAWPPPNESGQDSPYADQNQVPSQGGPQYPYQSPAGLQQNNYQAPAAPQQNALSPKRAPLKPLDVRSPSASSPLASPNLNQSPQAFRPTTPTAKGWAPVHSPVPSPAHAAPQFPSAHQPVSQQTYLGQQYQPAPPQQYQIPVEQYQAPPQQYQAPPQQYQAPPKQYQAPPQQYQVPPQQYQAPPQQYQTPPQQYQAPPQQYQAPPQQYQAPLPQNQVRPEPYQIAPGEYIIPIQQSQKSSDNSYQYQYETSTKQYQTSSQYQTPQLVLSTNQSSQYSSSTQSPQPQYQAPPYSTAKPEGVTSQVAPRAAAKPVQPPPSTITLRPQAPVSQAPPPVFTSQPATATLKVKVGRKHLRGDQKWPPEDVRQKMLREAENVYNSNSFLSLEGGKNLRGDLKWPPENVKSQAEEENRLRLELAKGPAFRPKRPNKDYTQFFQQHALNSTYPGYKIPPGTQFYRVD